MFFLVSHLVGGFLLSHVVTFNHYSVEKFACKLKLFWITIIQKFISVSSNIMSNYACLQIMTTRNMRPGRFIDWLWGGLNYQVNSLLNFHLRIHFLIIYVNCRFSIFFGDTIARIQSIYWNIDPYLSKFSYGLLWSGNASSQLHVALCLVLWCWRVQYCQFRDIFHFP